LFTADGNVNVAVDGCSRGDVDSEVAHHIIDDDGGQFVLGLGGEHRVFGADRKRQAGGRAGTGAV
jgi:hypothetical protein